LLLEGYCARFTAGYHASVGPLRAAVAALRADDLDPATGLRWFALGVLAAGSLWDEQAVFDLSDRWVRMARALGALTILPVALKFLAISDWLAGRLGDADEQLAEVQELLIDSHRPRLIGMDSRDSGLLLAYRGRITEARAAGMAQVHESTARGQQSPADVGRLIVAVADLFGGDYQAAIPAALSVVDGLITNGKFCCVRRVRLSLSWWRRPLRLRRSVLQSDVALVGEPDEPDMDRLPPVQPEPRWRAPVGPGLPVAGAPGWAGRPAQPGADCRGGA
jgi:hypothetical protein